MVKRKLKTLKDYLLNGTVMDKVFIDKHENRPYKVLDIKEVFACGFTFAYLDIHYIDKRYKEKMNDIRSLTLGLDDLKTVIKIPSLEGFN